MKIKLRTAEEIASGKTATGMLCPRCKGRLHVTHTIQMDDGAGLMRYRHCHLCGYRTSTEEKR